MVTPVPTVTPVLMEAKENLVFPEMLSKESREIKER